MADHIESWEKEEEKLNRIETGPPLPDSWRITALECMVVGKIDGHASLNAGRLGTYAPFRSEIMKYAIELRKSNGAQGVSDGHRTGREYQWRTWVGETNEGWIWSGPKEEANEETKVGKATASMLWEKAGAKGRQGHATYESSSAIGQWSVPRTRGKAKAKDKSQRWQGIATCVSKQDIGPGSAHRTPEEKAKQKAKELEEKELRSVTGEAV